MEFRREFKNECDCEKNGLRRRPRGLGGRGTRRGR